jgi:hypothetical protein
MFWIPLTNKYGSKVLIRGDQIDAISDCVESASYEDVCVATSSVIHFRNGKIMKVAERSSKIVELVNSLMSKDR